MHPWNYSDLKPFLSTFSSSCKGFSISRSRKSEMDSRTVEHSATAAWMESLLSSGEIDLVLRRLLGSVDGIRNALSSDCVHVAVCEWRNSSGGEREGKVSEGKDGWFDRLVNEFLVGWECVGIVFEGDIVDILLKCFLFFLVGGFLNGGLLGLFLNGFLWDSSYWACWGWEVGVVFVLVWQKFLALPFPLSLLFKIWYSSIGMSLLV